MRRRFRLSMRYSLTGHCSDCFNPIGESFAALRAERERQREDVDKTKSLVMRIAVNTNPLILENPASRCHKPDLNSCVRINHAPSMIIQMPTKGEHTTLAAWHAQCDVGDRRNRPRTGTQHRTCFASTRAHRYITDLSLRTDSFYFYFPFRHTKRSETPFLSI
jgi:hypothetical protein